MADEIWDGNSSLVFKSGDKTLAGITIGNDSFDIHIAGEDFTAADESGLGAVFSILERPVASSYRRPLEQLVITTTDPEQFSCGRCCDLCLGSKKSDGNNYSQAENFGYLNWVCYHNCVPNVEVDRWDGVFNCPGCAETRKTENCKYYPCPTEKGHANCVECGKYHSCEVYSDCHYPGQCNLGITAEEVTSLVIPYAAKERLDLMRSSNNGVF
jgi:hypothetical protein